MPSKITALTAYPAPLSTDVMPVVDLTGPTTKKSTLAQIVSSVAPKTHAASHAFGGSDPVTLTEAQITGLVADLAAKATLSFTKLATNVTGFVNDYTPGLVGHTIEFWNGVNDVAFTGLAGGVAGQIYIFKNTGAKVATFANLSASSAAANKYTNAVQSAPVPVAPRGSITYVHDGTNWQLIAHNQGIPISPAFAAGVFNGSGAMTWTVDAGDVQGFAYSVDAMRGRMTLYCSLTATSIGGTPNTTLLVTIPGSFTSSLIQVNAGGRVSDNGVDGVGIVFSVGSGSSQISILKVGSANFSLSVNNTTVQLTIEFGVN